MAKYGTESKQEVFKAVTNSNPLITFYYKLLFTSISYMRPFETSECLPPGWTDSLFKWLYFMWYEK